MKFSALRKVRFSDCDPAGIVFYPAYLVMLNGFVEQWFDEGLQLPYAELIGTRRLGLPTVRLEVDFTAISRHGDVLTLCTQVQHLGRSSFTLHTSFHGGEALRLRVRQVLACTSLESHRPQALPDELRAALAHYLNEEEAP